MVESQENWSGSDEEEGWDSDDMMDAVSPYQEVEYDPFNSALGYKMLTREGIANLQAKMIETMVEEKGYNKLYVRTLLIKYDWKVHRAEDKYFSIDWPMADKPMPQGIVECGTCCVEQPAKNMITI